MKYSKRAFLPTCLLLSILIGLANAQPHRRSAEQGPTHPGGQNCYDANDPTEVRLWDGRAPGATGDDPCRDIPYLKMFPAAGSARATHTAIIVMPGGGYDRLSDRKEQAPVGEYFSQQLHATTFVLYYRLVQPDGTYRYPVPMWDAQRAIRLVSSRATQYGIDPHRLGLFGFSAGGHLASTVALHAHEDFGLTMRDAIDDTKASIAFLGLGYPVISMLPDQYASANSLDHLLDGYDGREKIRLEHHLSGQDNVTPLTPPVFLFESMDDKQISAQNSVLFAQALHDANVPADVHLFPRGVHGAGLAVGIPDEEAWPSMFRDWLGKLGYLR
jgi:acetyl esterase/lipase